MSEKEFDKTFADADAKSSSYLQYFKNLVQPLLASAQVFGSGDNSAHRQGMKKVFLSSKKFLPGFESVLDRMLADWPTEGRVDLAVLLHSLVFKLVMVIMAGHDAEGTDGLLNACTDCLGHFTKRYSTPLFDENISDEDERNMKMVESAAMEMTLAFKRKFDAGTLPETSESSMLAVMMGIGLSDEETNATMVNALFAACEAPIHVLATTLQELSRQGDIQDKLFNDLNKVEKVMDSKLLNAVTLEGLRLFSPVTLVQRCAIQDLVVEGYHVPKGTVVGVVISAVHANEKTFKNAEQFDPFRTKLNMVMISNKNAFMPFSGGPRGCPGRYLAATILKTAIGRILQKYELLPSKNIADRRVFKFVEFPANGSFVNLIPRTIKAPL